MADINTGLTAWQKSTNHNRMIDLQQKGHTDSKQPVNGTGIEIDYFGSSAFRITSPEGITIMLDPWRNHPARKWDWYFQDFPETAVDIGVSTHAHFDHDALHRLDAHVLLDRLIGTWQFRDIIISGIAEKHATDSSAALYDFKKIILDMDGVDITPPGNPRSWDNCLVTVETGGLRTLHWGDNRYNPPEPIWEALGNIDILLIPVDNSQHVLSHENVDAIIARLKPKVVIPHHYYIQDVVQRQSTLLPVGDWLSRHQGKIQPTDGAHWRTDAEGLGKEASKEGFQIVYFGDHVAFDTGKWRKGG